MLSDSPTKLQILGSETPLIVGQPHNITCFVDTYDENNVTLEWTLGGKDLQGTVDLERGGDGNSAKRQLVLNYDFTAGDENKQLVCAVYVLYVDPPGRCFYSTAVAVDLYCEWFHWYDS